MRSAGSPSSLARHDRTRLGHRLHSSHQHRSARRVCLHQSSARRSRPYQARARQQRRDDLRVRKDWQVRRRGRVPRQPRSPVPWSGFATSVQPLSSARVVCQDRTVVVPAFIGGERHTVGQPRSSHKHCKEISGANARFEHALCIALSGISEHLKNCAPTAALADRLSYK
jgi:hypothetical protein